MTNLTKVLLKTIQSCFITQVYVYLANNAFNACIWLYVTCGAWINYMKYGVFNLIEYWFIKNSAHIAFSLFESISTFAVYLITL